MLARAVQDVRPEAELVLGRSGNGKRTKTEIGLHAIRMGNIVGEHEVLIGTDSQTISLKHEAHDRALFAEGAAAAAELLAFASLAAALVALVDALLADAAAFVAAVCASLRYACACDAAAFACPIFAAACSIAGISDSE
jgi:hypothetical protein